MKQFLIPLLLLFCCSFFSCKSTSENYPEGSLYIIGGGKRPPEMVKEMIAMSGTDESGSIVILPMSSAEPDTSAFYASRQFNEQGSFNIEVLILDNNDLSEEEHATLLNASLIYIPGEVSPALWILSRIRILQPLSWMHIWAGP